MIIECINCNKKFQVNSELIPKDGRTIQCGSCDHVWFFKKKKQNQSVSSDLKIQNEIIIPSNNTSDGLNDDANLDKDSKDFIEIKKTSRSSFTFIKLLSYTLISIISFVGLIILLDTFKSPLYSFFPNLEFILFNLFETLKDIYLFIKDLI